MPLSRGNVYRSISMRPRARTNPYAGVERCGDEEGESRGSVRRCWADGPRLDGLLNNQLVDVVRFIVLQDDLVSWAD